MRFARIYSAARACPMRQNVGVYPSRHYTFSLIIFARPSLPSASIPTPARGTPSTRPHRMSGIGWPICAAMRSAAQSVLNLSQKRNRNSRSPVALGVRMGGRQKPLARLVRMGRFRPLPRRMEVRGRRCPCWFAEDYGKFVLCTLCAVPTVAASFIDTKPRPGNRPGLSFFA